MHELIDKIENSAMHSPNNRLKWQRKKMGLNRLTRYIKKEGCYPRGRILTFTALPKWFYISAAVKIKE